MDESGLSARILKLLGYEPTTGQMVAAKLLAQFVYCRPGMNLHPMFMLKGYAGTGKTTLVSALVKALPETGIKTILLAPTGRAAKVLGSYAGTQAFTIHKKLYIPKVLNNGNTMLVMRENMHKSTLFIVDEASMIQNTQEAGFEDLFATRNLLADLIEYVYSNNCRLVLIGDSAQLPPVGADISPALDKEYLRKCYPLQIYHHELTDVVRQELASGILHNATLLRVRLETGNFDLPFFQLRQFSDIRRIDGSALEELLHDSLRKSGIESLVIITRSNKRANMFNRAIRSRVLYRETEIAAGDLMMVVRNNYHWLSAESQAGFIANGDLIEILRIKRHEELYGFGFADVAIRMLDYPDEPELEVKILLNTLESESPALSKSENKKLFEEVMLDYADIGDRNRKYAELRNNPWFNALQVKFAYALTCHKTQGGQWDVVFIDQGFISDQNMDREYFRWLYTALTRATKRVYLVNFEDKFFDLP